MSKDLVTTDELAFLAKKNKEMMIEECLDEALEKQLQTIWQQAVEAGSSVAAETTKEQMKSIELKEIAVASAQTVSPQLEAQGLVILAQTQPDQGQHLIVVSCDNSEDLVMDDVTAVISDTVLNVYHEVAQTMGLSSAMTVLTTEQGRLEELETLKQFDFNQLAEIKTMDITWVNDAVLKMWIASDVNYFEKVCKVLTAPSTSEEKSSTAPVVEEVKQEETVDVYKPVFQPLTEVSTSEASADLKVLSGVSLEISAVLGRTKCSIQDLLELNVGAIIELDKLIDEPIEIYANNKQIAEGELVVIEDNFGVKLTRLIK